VKLKVLPGAILPESNDVGPEVEVTVWVVESLFVHVTVVPTVTVRGVGEKAKFLMFTEFPVDDEPCPDGLF
jgi:hypothetical protein